MSVVVFLGPSLAIEEGRALVDATFLPPAKAGDIVRALALKPEAIGIVDGYFDRVPSVWHKEILYALSQGIAVYGASSMGALRAAELHPFGMIGIGRVFEAFRDGVLEDDDEVAIVHATAECAYRPASDAMVNIRIGLARAAALGVIDRATAAALVDSSKTKFYPDRSWRAVLEDATHLGVPMAERDRLDEFLRRERPDQKRDDARELLQRLATRTPAERPPDNFEFHPTAYWQRLVDEVEPIGADASASSNSALAIWSRVRSGGDSDVLRDASVLYLIGEAVDFLGLRVPEECVERARARFRERDLPEDDLDQLAAAEAILETLRTTRAPLVDSFVRLAMAKRGELATAEKALAHRQALLRERGFEDADLVRAGLTMEELLAWYSAQAGATERTPEALAARLGIQPRKMIDEILRWYLTSRP